jgi:hypothetical protein
MKILLLSSIIFFSNLIDYKNDEFNFEVKLPQGYKVEKDAYEEKFASIESIRITADLESNISETKGDIVYRVISERFKSKPIIESQKLDLHEVIVAYAKHINSASFEANNLSVISFIENGDTLNYILQNRQRELKEYRKIIIHDNYTYCLSILSRDLFLTEEKINLFFNSLIINE